EVEQRPVHVEQDGVIVVPLEWLARDKLHGPVSYTPRHAGAPHVTTPDDELLAAVADIAESAGTAILDVYETEFAVEAKADASPITAADRRAHDVIRGGLLALPGERPILSEEA